MTEHSGDVARRPRLLETHGCQGGATAGYQRAGWHVTAVDINRNHAKYSPADAFVIGDAETFIREHGHEYDAIHTSPPCQWYTRGNAPRRGTETKWERTIPPIREALEATGRPYVIENVKDAGWDLIKPVTLCGCMFDLSTIDTDGIRIHLQRPRLFETNWGMTAPKACDHSAHEWVAGAYGGARRDKYEAKYVRRGGYVPPSKPVVSALLGVEHHMTWNGLYECLPPAYTEHIARQLLSLIPPARPRCDTCQDTGQTSAGDFIAGIHYLPDDRLDEGMMLCPDGCPLRDDEPSSTSAVTKGDDRA